MRREPAVSLQFPLAHAARGPLALLGGAGVASASACGLGWASAGSIDVMVAGLVLPLAAMVGSVVGWRAAGSGTIGLRFDGECWHLRRIGKAAAPGRPQEAAVRLQVAVDLETWMLVRCTFDPSRARLDLPSWMALRRSDLEPNWHAFRSAVYSPRSTSLSGVAGNPADP